MMEGFTQDVRVALRSFIRRPFFAPIAVVTLASVHGITNVAGIDKGWLGGGNPGRNEIDETQELNYAAIMRAILATGYKGHVGQEFIPKRKDKLASLEQGVRICDV